KGMLDIRFSQIITRLLPISTFIAYALVYFMDRQLMLRSAYALVWTVYLAPMIVLGGIGAARIIKLCGSRRFRFVLPDGFWRYALGSQQAGIAAFLAYRIDYIFVLNYGGLGVLGRYVAVLTIAGLVAIIDGFFMDTLLPSLTNMFAERNS